MRFARGSVCCRWGQLAYRAYQLYMPTFGVLQKLLWSMPFSLGIFIVNMQLLHWACVLFEPALPPVSSRP